MSGIAPFAIFHVTRVAVTFIDELGNSKKIHGTGFWVEKSGDKFFVTNAHNIDPSMKLGAKTTFRLEKVEILIRFNPSGSWSNITREYEVINPDIRLHSTADVAILVNPDFGVIPAYYHYTCFAFENLATEECLTHSIHPMDVASFLGYPGSQGLKWYDEIWTTAIARTVNIASIPAISFTNSAISTTDTTLVSGLSFSGSSGSPVLSHEKGIKLGVGLSGGNYQPPYVIGIMSGHWHEKASDDKLAHTGLSYLTRSTSIIDVINGSSIRSV